ncbi:MAG: M23 family metallopeptidase [Mollicutes bacterium]|nr:M23 family metallopeptidase [Mollicutes bacterium]
MSDTIIVESGYVTVTFEGNPSSEYKIISEDIFHASNNTEAILGITAEQLEAYKNSLKVSFTDYGYIVNAYKIDLLKDNVSYFDDSIFVDIIKSNDINIYKIIKVYYLPTIDADISKIREIKHKSDNEKISFEYIGSGYYVIVGNNNLLFDATKNETNILSPSLTLPMDKRKKMLDVKNQSYKIAFQSGKGFYPKSINTKMKDASKDVSSTTSSTEEKTTTGQAGSLNKKTKDKKQPDEKGGAIDSNSSTSPGKVDFDFDGFSLSPFDEEDEEKGFAGKLFKNNKKRRGEVNNTLSHLTKYPKEIIAIVIFVIVMASYILFTISVIISSESEKNPLEKYKYVDERYDFSKVTIRINNPEGTDIENPYIESANIKDYVLGSIYLDYYGKLEELNTSQFTELAKAKAIVNKTKLLKVSGYTSGLMEGITNNSDEDIAHCNVYSGCKKVSYGNKNVYISSNITIPITGQIIEEIPPASEEVISILNTAYIDTVYNLLTDKDFSKPLTSHLDLPNITVNETNDNLMLNSSLANKNHLQIIDTVPEYQNYKIYNLLEYASMFSTVSPIKYWWPIGGEKASESGIYSGKPTTTTIANYFVREIDDENPKINLGIDIIPENPEDNAVVIAVSDGTIVRAKSSCGGSSSPECTTYGNHVVIDHGNRIYSIYGNLGSVSVSEGAKVKMGEKIGTMGKGPKMEGNYLYFSMAVGSMTSYTNPLEYVSPVSPRPSFTIGINYVEGVDNKQTVCLSLLASGFSPYATAGLMANIRAESNFSPTALGDHGSSFGICQWNKERWWVKLRKFCGADEAKLGCQLPFLLHELKENQYKRLYNLMLTGQSEFDIGFEFCYRFERPASKDSGGCHKRGNSAKDFIGYVSNNCS